MSEWKKHHTALKIRQTHSSKVLCLSCRKYAVTHNGACNECKGIRLVTTGTAYRVPRRGNNKEWNFLNEIFDKRFDGSEEILYVGFYQNRTTYRNSYDGPTLTRKQKNIIAKSQIRRV